MGAVGHAFQSMSETASKLTKPISKRFSDQIERVRHNWWVEFTMGICTGLVLLAIVFGALYFLFLGNFT